MAKRVLIFSTAYLPLVGGAEIAIKEITSRIPAHEIEWDLITAKLDKGLKSGERIGNVNVHRLGIGWPLFDKLILPFAGAIKALSLNREKHYDYFWCVMASFAAGAAYIANWFQKKVPIILTLQEGDSEAYLKFKWFGLIDLSWRLALARTSILTAISNYLLDRARRLGFKGEAHLIPNGVDLHRFKIHDSGFKNRIITVSRLTTKNGVEHLIEAMQYLPEDVTLTIVGTGPLESRLKRYSKILNLESRIKFVGFASNDDLPKYLNEADIFVRPSLSEGQGISFIEAMATGLPVIATPVGGITDFLKDGETGVCCEPKNPKSIAAAVERLLNDPVLRGRVVTNALQMVKERYDWDLIVQDMKKRVFKPYLN